MMKKVIAFLKSKFILLYLFTVLAVPVFTTLTACGDDVISGPRVEDDKVDKGQTGDGESD